MTAWKLKASNIEVDNDQTQWWLFVAPSPDRTYQRCGVMTLTPAEGRDLKRRLIVSEGVEYEYCVEFTPVPGGGNAFRTRWGTHADALDNLIDDGKTKMLRRRKAGEVEVVS